MPSMACLPAGIKAPIIKDSMVADDASISGYKVNVQTLVQNINSSNVQIMGSKVVVDGTSQTISAKFDSMQEEIDSYLLRVVDISCRPM